LHLINKCPEINKKQKHLLRGVFERWVYYYISTKISKCQQEKVFGFYWETVAVVVEVVEEVDTDELEVAGIVFNNFSNSFNLCSKALI
jgi:hypothetical protein